MLHLNLRERELLQARLFECKTVDEISQSTGIGKTSVKSMVSMAKKKIMVKLKQHLGKTKPDLKVYIYASTEATQKEVDRAVGIMHELGIKNYEIVKNIPIRHWTDGQYRQWATKQKQAHPAYDAYLLFDILAGENIEVDDLNAKWHIVKSVYGVK